MGDLTDIGRALVDERKAAHLTQAALAERLGVTRQQVQRWESRSYHSASLERVAAVAAALGIDAVVVGGEVHLTRATGAGLAAAAGGSTPPASDLGEIVRRVRSAGDELRDTYGVRRLGIFGSFAEGRQAPDSDVDVLVEMDDRDAGTRGLAAFLTAELGREVDVTTPERLRWEIRGDVLREVVRVWAA